MALHETLKNAKIVEEIFAYLLDKGCSKVNVCVEVLNEEIKYEVTFKYDEKIIKELKEDMYCSREQELEEYGWELMGENEDCDLQTIGMLVDEYEAEIVDGNVILVFHRKK